MKLKKITFKRAKKLFDEGKGIVIEKKGAKTEPHYMYPQYVRGISGVPQTHVNDRLDDFENIIEFQKGRWGFDFDFYVIKKDDEDD